ncbi:MAG: sulfite exporter TauE/SafE family protein [bacterium]|jgi:uncharacterized membrane protein YfcA
MHFPVSGIDVPFYVPPLVAFVISAMTSGAGVSGGFLLLPFQVSVLGFTGPGVTPTNLLYNVVATPGGVYSYSRQGRMNWPLAAVLIAGTLPGVFAGALIRMRFLPDPRSFKMFAGCVLLYLAVRLILSAGRAPARDSADAETSEPRINRAAVTALAAVVGLVGGIYGIGGGAIIAPFLVAVLRMRVTIVAGAALFTTFATSVAGVTVFEVLGSVTGAEAVRPDWLLGLMLGVGGLAGTYTGARLQRYVPERLLKLVLAALVSIVAVGYVVPFFWKW